MVRSRADSFRAIRSMAFRTVAVPTVHNFPTVDVTYNQATGTHHRWTTNVSPPAPHGEDHGARDPEQSPGAMLRWRAAAAVVAASAGRMVIDAGHDQIKIHTRRGVGCLGDLGQWALLKWGSTGNEIRSDCIT